MSLPITAKQLIEDELSGGELLETQKEILQLFGGELLMSLLAGANLSGGIGIAEEDWVRVRQSMSIAGSSTSANDFFVSLDKALATEPEDPDSLAGVLEQEEWAGLLSILAHAVCLSVNVDNIVNDAFQERRGDIDEGIECVSMYEYVQRAVAREANNSLGRLQQALSWLPFIHILSICLRNPSPCFQHPEQFDL
ncbi:MAG TPA: hypothetical protein VLE93_03770 [Candidatus Saccharimonadales bacterium]|nr:hypothetical protein [Candidatus Saccharimonadales bacterium]